MASPSRINILISVKNRASVPIDKTRKSVRNFRDELVKFNRRLFTASAVYATFAMGFRKAFNLAKIGADFDFFRQQFDRTFGDQTFLPSLRRASAGTVDALSMMQIAVQNHSRGMKKAETQQIFGLSVKAAKLMGVSTAVAAKKMSSAFHTMSVTGMQNFFVALNTNNQFRNMEVMLGKLTGGLNKAGRSAANFRKVALRELERALSMVNIGVDDTQTIFMKLGSSFESMKGLVGSFVARAMGPLANVLQRIAWDGFDSLKERAFGAKGAITQLGQGLVDFIKMGGGIIASAAAMVGSLSLLALGASTLGISFGGIVSGLILFTSWLKHSKDKSGGWLKMLSDIGTELKVYFEIFTSYRDGIATLSGEVANRLAGMSESSRNRILMISKAFALLREAFDGFTGAIKTSISLLSKMFGLFGMGGGVKQFSSSIANVAKSLGGIAGFAAVIFGLKAAVSKIPVIGKYFGGKSAFGRRPKGTANDPIHVTGGMFGTFGGGLGGLTKGLLGKAGLVGAAGMAGYLGATALGADKLGEWLEEKTFGKQFGGQFSTDMGSRGVFTPDKVVKGKQGANLLSSKLGDSTGGPLGDLLSKMRETNKGEVDMDQVRRFEENGFDNRERNLILKQIRDSLMAAGVIKSDKPNRWL